MPIYHDGFVQLLDFSRLLFFFQAEDGIRDWSVTGVQTCAFLISSRRRHTRLVSDWSSDVCSSDLSLGTQGPAGGFVLAAVPKGPQAHTVVIREVKFQPTVLTVKVGDTVEWRNDDIVPHTATSTEPRKFDSGILPVGSSWKYVVTKRGTYFYTCTLHPNMKATLIVR